MSYRHLGPGRWGVAVVVVCWEGLLSCASRRAFVWIGVGGGHLELWLSAERRIVVARVRLSGECGAPELCIFFLIKKRITDQPKKE